MVIVLKDSKKLKNLQTVKNKLIVPDSIGSTVRFFFTQHQLPIIRTHPGCNEILIGPNALRLLGSILERQASFDEKKG